jgi:microcystin-dependent protein
MSRNGSGTYTVPNTFVAGTTITASSHNQNWDDLASEMTNSVAADGQTSMTGALKCSSGTLALPSQSFAADTNTGRYRKASDTMADVCGGTEIVEISSTGISVTGTVDATTVKQGGFSLMPVGSMFPYAGSSAPSGYLLCRGQTLSRTTYAALFAAIGTSYGAGDGSTTFAIPDLRGRVPAGADDIGNSNRLTSSYFGADSHNLGATGGSESHTLTTAQLASHTHSNSLNDPGHSHGVTLSNGATAVLTLTGGSGTVTGGGTSSSAGLSVNSNTTGATITNAAAGSGNAHNNVQPTIITNYIIFAGV